MDRKRGSRPPWSFDGRATRAPDPDGGEAGTAGGPAAPPEGATRPRPPWSFAVPPDGRAGAGEEGAAAAAAEGAAGGRGLSPGAGVRGIRNSALVLVAQLGSRLLALGTVIVILHSLGAGAFGQMQTAITYGAIVGVIADMGLSTLLAREGARRPEMLGRYLDNLLSLRIPMAAAAVLVLVALLWLLGLPSLIVASAALVVVSGVQVLLRNALYALQRGQLVAAEIIPEALLLLGLVVLGALRDLGASYFIWAYALSYAAAALYYSAVLLAIGAWRPRLRFDTGQIGPWLRMTLPLAVSYVFTTLYWQIDVPILQHFGPSTPAHCPTLTTLSYCEVGWYQAAYRPFQALLVVPFALRSVVFPLLSVYHREAPERLVAATRMFFKALFILGLPASLGVVVLADRYTSLLSLYPQSAPALRLLGATIVFMFVDNACVTALLAMDRQRTFAWVVGAGIVVNVALNVALIPVFEGVHAGSGYLVASADTAVTEIAMVVAGLTVLRRIGVAIPVVRLVWRTVPAALLMGGFLLLVHPSGRLATVLITLVAAAIYAALLVLFRAVDAQERGLIRRALGRSR